MKDRKKFVEMLTALSEVLVRDRPLSEMAIQLYWSAVDPYTDDEVITACSRLVSVSKFFPTPAELIETISGNSSDKKVLAWEKVLKALSKYGVYQSVRFDDLAIHSTLQLMGGWIEAGKWTYDELKWKQKEFDQIYSTMSKRTEHPDHLDGIYAIENTSKGYLDAVPEVKQIGAPKVQKEIAA